MDGKRSGTVSQSANASVSTRCPHLREVEQTNQTRLHIEPRARAVRAGGQVAERLEIDVTGKSRMSYELLI
jgi:hypothetical protein